MSQFTDANKTLTSFNAPPTNYTQPTPDPTLDACCAREEVSKDLRMQAERKVKEGDRVFSRQRVKDNFETQLRGGFFENNICGCCNNVVGDYKSLRELKEELNEKVTIHEEEAMMSRVTETRYDSDTDSEFDYLLDEHESSTNDEAEYIASIQLQTRLQNHGYGSFLNVTNVSKYMSGSTLIHYYKDTKESAEYDVELERVAGRFKGTRFVRVEGGGRIGVFKDGGEVVGVRYGELGGKEAVEEWCERVGLEREVGGRICFEKGEGEESEDDEEECEYYDCGMEGCKKEFYHQHVGVGESRVVNDLEDLRV
ncbi:hypothetical protein TrST_g14213 [Triparma strigata]|uniref:Uncharacterized protein n=1 Tax=Triparma strigata TaxID=1606541 RepID=A0A9W7F0F6_9STRA|nr:hypothetical protein TrST_g14213 [Triparma strigata]